MEYLLYPHKYLHIIPVLVEFKPKLSPIFGGCPVDGQAILHQFVTLGIRMKDCKIDGILCKIRNGTLTIHRLVVKNSSIQSIVKKNDLLLKQATQDVSHTILYNDTPTVQLTNLLLA